MNKMKISFCSLTGIIGSVIASIFGGWSSALTTLLIFMAIDFLTGLIVAGVFHQSKKTETGALESKACFKGLCRKCLTLLFVLIGYRLDLMIGTSYIKDAVCIAFTTSDLISIVENAGLMGLPIPSVITSAIDILKKKGDVLNED